MLKHLYIRNYALFEETQVDFPNGLNILTGETGAGKSMLIGALGLINGKRADNSVIFHHEDKCIVEAKFGSLGRGIMTRLGGYSDFDIEDGDLIIRREIRPSGKSRAFINDTPVSLQVLREVSAMLLDMHGQNESHSLLAAEKQIDLIDAFADTSEMVEAFSAKLKESQRIDKEIRELEAKESEARQQLEYINFQIQELEAAGIEADEEEQLEQELNLLQNAEEIKESLGGATELLYHQELSLYNQLSEGIEQLRKISDVSSKIADEVSRLVEAQNTIKESAFLFQDMLETTESDPERLAFIEERLAVYHKLKLKYQAKNGAELVELFERLQGQLDEFNSIEETIDAKKQTASAIKDKLIKLGLKIEAARNKAKISMEKNIIDFLTNVGFNKARFEVAVERMQGSEGDLLIDGQWVKSSPKGLNKVYFVIQTNPGMPAGPLSQVASGGEISRVMLAIKAALADKSEFPVLIFDEIDSGISGEIAHKVGNVMRKLSNRYQIISITHLPQIAGKGDQHFRIFKEVRGEKTVSNVFPLNEEDRINELAKMISGDQPSSSALENARELIRGREM